MLLKLDAGGSLLGDWYSVKSEGQVIIDGMNLLGYDAMGVGRMELALGLELALDAAKSAEFPLLSANVVDSESKKPIFQPYATFERNGVRIGIIGLSEDNANAARGVQEVVTVLPAVETARALVPQLRPEVDLLILLSHLGIEEDHAVAAAVPGIDIIVGGNTRKLMREPEREGDTLIIQQGYSGEWVGRLSVKFDEDGVPSDIKTDVITLDDQFQDDPQMAALVAKYMEMYPPPTPMPTRTLSPELQKTQTAAATK